MRNHPIEASELAEVSHVPKMLNFVSRGEMRDVHVRAALAVVSLVTFGWDIIHVQYMYPWVGDW